MRMTPPQTPGARRRRSMAAALGLAALAALALAQTARATDGAFHFPAPAGTEWSVAAGYNTATHSWADGGDPYALDLVRTDAPSAGTPVLAPTSGTLSFVQRSGSQCVGLRDRAGNRILLCHLDIAASIDSGDSVEQGDLLGTVAPAGAAMNNGLAHIHLAVHAGNGSWSSTSTIPFAGDYAIEGVDLPATDEANAYAGRTFRSSNGVAAGRSPAPLAGLSEPDPVEGSGTIEGGSLPPSGFGFIVFGGGTNDQLVAAAGCPVTGLRFWSVEASHFVAYIPAAADFVNAQWQARFPSGIPAGTPLIGRCA